MNRPTPKPFDPAYLHEMRERTQQLAETFNTAGVGFILTELDSAITFCQVALTCEDPAHARRDADQAQRALQTVTRLKGRLHFNDGEVEQIAEMTARLDALLKRLAERLDASADHA